MSGPEARARTSRPEGWVDGRTIRGGRFGPELDRVATRPRTVTATDMNRTRSRASEWSDDLSPGASRRTPSDAMTDLDDTTTHPVAPAPPAPRRAPAPGRRRGPRRLPWVMGSVALGALLGAGGALAYEGRHWPTAADTPTTTVEESLSVPSGLISGRKPAARPVTHSIDNRVFIVGDSVMQGASPYLAASPDGWSLTIDTKVGRFIDEANAVIGKRRSKIGQIAVLNLGNNYGGDQAAFAASVETSLTLLSGVEHVIWVNAAEFQSDRSEVNQVLTDAARRHPNLTIVDWNTWWSEHREFTGGDHLHLTPDGAKAYASLVALAIKQVTDEAGEVPATGAASPSLNTSGTIPGASGTSGSGSSRRKSSGSATRSTNRPTTSAPQSPTTAATGKASVPIEAPTPTTGATKPTTPVTSPPATTPPSSPSATAPSP